MNNAKFDAFGNTRDEVEAHARKVAGMPDGIVTIKDDRLYLARTIGDHDKRYYAMVTVTPASAPADDPPYTLEELALAASQVGVGTPDIQRRILSEYFEQAHKNRVFGKQPRRTNYKATL